MCLFSVLLFKNIWTASPFQVSLVTNKIKISKKNKQTKVLLKLLLVCMYLNVTAIKMI